jgi:amino acid transporter
MLMKNLMMILRIILIIVPYVILSLILSWIDFNIMNFALVLKNMIII